MVDAAVVDPARQEDVQDQPRPAGDRDVPEAAFDRGRGGGQGGIPESLGDGEAVYGRVSLLGGQTQRRSF